MLSSVAASAPISDIEFTILLSDMLQDLRRYARRLCQRKETAEDLVLETLGKAWAARERFLPGTSFRAWAFRILRSLFVSRARQAKAGQVAGLLA